jgi:hypothetical protein
MATHEKAGYGRKEIIRKAMAYPLDKVMFRYRQDTGLSEREARRHERELKRFLALCAASERGYGMRGPIDNLWHTLILFTHVYENFCRDVAGRFIHHFPNIQSYDGPGEPPLDLGDADYMRFLKDYEAIFGERPEPPYWPPAAMSAAPAGFFGVECASDDCGNTCGTDTGGTGGRRR